MLILLMPVQLTPDNLNLQGKLKKVQAIGSWDQMTRNKEENGVQCFSIHAVYILIKCNYWIEKLSETKTYNTSLNYCINRNVT